MDLQKILNFLKVQKKIVIPVVLILIIMVIPYSRNFLKYHIYDSMHMNPGYFFNAGVKYEEKGYIKFAVGSFKRALREEAGKFDIDPRNAYQLESLYNLGVIYYQHLKNYAQALYYFNSYIGLFEKMNAKIPHEKDILKVINYILSVDDSSKNARAKSFKKKGTEAYFRKDYEKALEFYHQALTLDPSYVEVYINLASTYLQMNDFKKAVEYWKITLLFNPEEKLDIIINIAKAYEEILKDKNEAVMFLEKFLEEAPEDDYRVEAVKNKIQELRRSK